ncbi:hypothetical protein HNQ03_001555 [Chryseobacterium sp. 16F]|uniref:Uncharacterized protein n=1 Tax=Frigoriflavimonas asaccharolytica TaxID=2735899 RepID=A0A8J8G880_9FLAO|nr:hypothetical protein [Frigoriflavimonas asaccharolytica]
MINFLRYFGLISYSLIILNGSMIALPFFFWLLFTIFDFGNIDQLFAIFALVGIILNFTKLKNYVPIALISFILMLSPILSRLYQVPNHLFNYNGFKIPLLLYFISFSTMISLLIKKKIFTN